MIKYYLDTSILLDFYEKRGINSEIALVLINKIIKSDILVIYSDLHILELKKLGYNREEIKCIINIAENNKIVHINKAQAEEGRRMQKYIKISYRDILHALIARDNEAILIYTDKHFEKLKYLIEIKKSQELI
ncbi:PIN domain-containing protein [Candidatus Woesearchaeota archaeon]|nr:PIN domain-containing protein [Candidatus Woesearchaeota archaeon]